MTRRQSRIKKLVSHGFLPSEAARLSHITQKGLEAPYIKRMIRERFKLYQNAQKEGLKKEQYAKLIKSKYKKLQIAEKDPVTKRYIRNKDGTVKISVYKLLKRYQRDYEKYNPPFDTPTKKRISKPKAVKKETNAQQSIRKHQEIIDQAKGRLQFQLPQSERARLENQIRLHQNAIDTIRDNK